MVPACSGDKKRARFERIVTAVSIIGEADNAANVDQSCEDPFTRQANVGGSNAPVVHPSIV